MKIYMPLLVLAVFLFAPAVQAMDFQPGFYSSGLLVGYDPESKTLTGYFSRARNAEDEKTSCAFFMRGTEDTQMTTIATWYPDAPEDMIAGEITAPDSGQLTLSLNKEHAGCAEVEHFSDKEETALFQLVQAYPWKAVRVVKSAKANFYPEAKSTAPLKAFLIRGDAVGVRTGMDGWMEVEYSTGKKSVVTWMKDSDFYPAERD